MKFFNKKWATMLELIVMMAIMALWVASMLWVIESWTYFSKDTEDTIKAINLAREWIEWVTNIRNTNWQRFSSDKFNCWKILDYSSNCIWGWVASSISSWSYKLYSQNGLWYLSGVTATFSDVWGADWIGYKTIYKTWIDTDGYYTQTGMTNIGSWCTSERSNNCLTQYTREIQVVPQGTGSLSVKSIVRWKWRRDQEIILDAVLTNWKSKF